MSHLWMLLAHTTPRASIVLQEYVRSVRFSDSLKKTTEEVVEMNPLSHTGSMTQAEPLHPTNTHPGFPKHPSFHHTCVVVF